MWHDLHESTEDITLRHVETIQVERPALTELRNQECQDLIRELRGLQTMKADSRYRAADLLEELRLWADTSVPLSADRTEITKHHHTFGALDNNTTNALAFTPKQLEDSEAQKIEI
jgi:hypothetical protein